MSVLILQKIIRIVRYVKEYRYGMIIRGRKAHRNYQVNNLLTLVFASIFLSLFGMISHDAFAMGAPPGTCNNEYDGPITFMRVTNGTYTIDPISNPNVAINMYTQNLYNVTFVIHTPSQSSQGNSDPGTTWFETDAIGYGSGACVSNVGPDQDVKVQGSWALPSQISRNHDYTAIPEFSTRVTTWPGVNFTINWIYPNATVPDAPIDLSATTVSSSQINLKWSAPSNDGGDYIKGYKIERSTDGGTNWSIIVANTGLEGTKWVCDNNEACSYVTTYSDTGLVHSTAYAYRVFAINSLGTSNPSATASATTFNVVPSPPTGLTATASTLRINLSWTAPSDNGGTPITGYMIEKSTNNGSTWSTLVANTGSTETTYSDKNVLPLTTYTYRVSTINDIGTGNPSNTASASTPSVSVPSPASLP